MRVFIAKNCSYLVVNDGGMHRVIIEDTEAIHEDLYYYAITKYNLFVT